MSLRVIAVALALAAPAYAQQRPAQMPSLPLTELDDRLLAAELDSRTFTLTFAQPLPINDLLLLIVRGTSLSVVPDPEITGSFMGELKNVTVRQALDLILPPLGLGYTVAGPVIRVFRRQAETRLFDVNYIASVRTGNARIGTDLPDSGGSYANVSTTTAGDIFTDLERGVQTLLSESATFNLDRRAGLLQVSDFPERLDRVAVYIETVLDHAHREVEIEARVLKVELNDEKMQTLDWTMLEVQPAATGAGGTSAPPVAPARRVTDVTRFVTALATQGTVSMVANPRLRAVNNEPAIVRVSSAAAARMAGGAAASSVESFTLSVTPHIAPGGIVMLSLSPILTMEWPGESGARVASTREADTLARVANGETIVLSGFGHEREARERRATGTAGWFGRSTVTTRKHVEVLILLTPRILTAAGGQ